MPCANVAKEMGAGYILRWNRTVSHLFLIIVHSALLFALVEAWLVCLYLEVHVCYSSPRTSASDIRILAKTVKYFVTSQMKYDWPVVELSSQVRPCWFGEPTSPSEASIGVLFFLLSSRCIKSGHFTVHLPENIVRLYVCHWLCCVLFT